MKFLILSYADDAFAPVTDIAYPNKLEYAQRHGYDVILARDTPDHVIRGDDPPSWTKLSLILNAFEKPDWDWLIWTDADSIFTNMTIPLSDLIFDAGVRNPKFWTEDLIFTRDENGLNAGCFLVRNSPSAYGAILDLSKMVEFKNHMWWEQGAMQKYFSDGLGRETYLAKRNMNSYPVEYPSGDWSDGDFILHVPGGSPADKVNYMTPYLNRIIR